MTSSDFLRYQLIVKNLERNKLKKKEIFSNINEFIKQYNIIQQTIIRIYQKFDNYIFKYLFGKFKI